MIFRNSRFELKLKFKGENMSLVIAVKKDDVVYFGSDSQSTSGTSKINSVSPDNMKVTKLKNDE